MSKTNILLTSNQMIKTSFTPIIKDTKKAPYDKPMTVEVVVEKGFHNGTIRVAADIHYTEVIGGKEFDYYQFKSVGGSMVAQQRLTKKYAQSLYEQHLPTLKEQLLEKFGLEI